MGVGLAEQWGVREPRLSRTHFGLYGAHRPTFIHVECMWVVYSNVVFMLPNHECDQVDSLECANDQ